MDVKRENLLNVLAYVQPGLAAKEAIEQSTSFIFEGGFVWTYNALIAVQHALPEDAKGLEGVVLAEDLFRVLSKSEEEVIKIRCHEGKMVIRSGKSQASLKMVSEIKITERPDTTDCEWTDLPDNFIDATKFCLFSVSKDMTNPVLICIHFAGDSALASDNTRITEYRLSGALVGSFLLPAEMAKCLVDRAPVGWAPDPATTSWIHFKDENGAVFSSRTYADSYPRERALGALDQKGSPIKFPAGLKDILERVGGFRSDEASHEGLIEVHLRPGEVTLKGKKATGTFKESARARYKGDPVMFLINPDFLSEIADHLQSCEITQNVLKFVCDDFTHVLAYVKGEAEADGE